MSALTFEAHRTIEMTYLLLLALVILHHTKRKSLTVEDSMQCRELLNKLSELMLRTPETLLQLVAKI